LDSSPYYFAAPLEQVLSLFPLSAFHSNHVLWDYSKSQQKQEEKKNKSLPSWQASCCVPGVPYPAWFFF
jgi:hypothetical protein